MTGKTIFICSFVAFLLLLQGCGNNGFHLRKPHTLAAQYQQVQLIDISDENDFSDAFQAVLEESGGQLVDEAPIKIVFSNFREGKRVVAYDKERKARVYLLFLKFEYQVTGLKNNRSLKERRINLDRTFLYDANFALGKAEEEAQIQQELYIEAARLILLRLQYSNK